MAKEFYESTAFKPETLALIKFINQIIAGYVDAGYMLSVRQIYYQLVARDLVSNTEQSYKNIARLLNNARMAGLMDWDAIEDRNRNIDIRNRWTSGKEILENSAAGFHMDMWDNQPNRVYVVVEKAALEGVLGGICHRYDVPLLAARGYPSVSIARELVVEHMLPALERGQCVTVLHLGDHDPSGIDMTRDLEQRFRTFIGGYEGDNFTLNRIALSMEQIRQQKPPPNPAKMTDSRFSGYAKKFGNKSWELDALTPEFTANLVETNILNHIDLVRWEERTQEIQHVRDQLKKVADKFKD